MCVLPLVWLLITSWAINRGTIVDTDKPPCLLSVPLQAIFLLIKSRLKILNLYFTSGQFSRYRWKFHKLSVSQWCWARLLCSCAVKLSKSILETDDIPKLGHLLPDLDESKYFRHSTATTQSSPKIIWNSRIFPCVAVRLWDLTLKFSPVLRENVQLTVSDKNGSREADNLDQLAHTQEFSIHE